MTDNLPAFDELNNIRTKLSGMVGEMTTEGRFDRKRLEDTIFELITMGYAYGIEVAGLDLEQDIPLRYERMTDTAWAKTAGETFADRVQTHINEAESALALEDLKSRVLVSGSDNSVGNLAGDKLSGGNVTNVRKSDPVTEAAHSVGASCSCVSGSERRIVKTLNVVNEASLLKLGVHLVADSGRGGADVLEGSGGALSESRLYLLDKLPAVEGVEEVYVSGTTVLDLYRKLASVLHVDLRGLLVGVTAVFEFVIFHFRSILS